MHFDRRPIVVRAHCAIIAVLSSFQFIYIIYIPAQPACLHCTCYVQRRSDSTHNYSRLKYITGCQAGRLLLADYEESKVQLGLSSGHLLSVPPTCSSQNNKLVASLPSTSTSISLLEFVPSNIHIPFIFSVTPRSTLTCNCRFRR